VHVERESACFNGARQVTRGHSVVLSAKNEQVIVAAARRHFGHGARHLRGNFT